MELSLLSFSCSCGCSLLFFKLNFPGVIDHFCISFCKVFGPDFVLVDYDLFTFESYVLNASSCSDTIYKHFSQFVF
jgi:hypothetical protein